MTDTSTVSVQVVDLEWTPGRGRFLGFAAVETVVDGISIISQGWRLSQRADGLCEVEPPVYRHADGDMVPAVVLPDELERAIARAVLEHAGASMLVAS